MIRESIATARTWRGPLGVTLNHMVLVLLAAVVLAGGYGGWRGYAASQQEWVAGTMPLSPEIEEKYGVRFSFLAVTAGGGMVELRYRVINEGKAANFGHYTETAPMLISKDNGKIVDVTIMGLHNHRVEPGRTYYVLYRNTDNAISSGQPVTIQIGELKLEHVVPW